MPARFAFVALTTLLALSGSAFAAVVQDSAETPDSRPKPPIRRVVVPEGMKASDRAPLLREGGIFVKVPGSIRRDERLGAHVFEPSSAEKSGLRRELILLPSRGLDDLDRLENAVAADEVKASRYEVSGKVLVYRGRNFLLPEAIFPVVDIVTTPDPVTPAKKIDDPTSPPTEEDLDRIGDDLERRLESRIGSVPRSLDVLEAPPAQRGIVPSGTRFVDRRGRLSRDPASGVWRFVLSGDGGGGASPSVVLLPCLELERIERQARQQDIVAPRLISGTVTTFRGRSYLLPTLSRPAVEGRGLGY